MGRLSCRFGDGTHAEVVGMGTELGGTDRYPIWSMPLAMRDIYYYQGNVHPQEIIAEQREDGC